MSAYSKIITLGFIILRTFRLFSKKIGANEFQRVYDSIDSISASKPDGHSQQLSSRAKSSNRDKELSDTHHQAQPNELKDMNNNNLSINAVNNRKISHQLGAQIVNGSSIPIADNLRSSRKRRSKNPPIIITNNKPEKQQLLAANDNSQKQRLESASFSSQNALLANADDTANISGQQNSSTINDPQQAQSSTEKSKISSPVNKNQSSMSTAVFGVPLSTIMQHTGQPLPQRILEAMRFIRKISPNEVGIFRKNGNKARINKLKESIDKNEPICFLSSDEITVFDIADTIKLYFRELPECLITNKLSDILLTNYTSKN